MRKLSKKTKQKSIKKISKTQWKNIRGKPKNYIGVFDEKILTRIKKQKPVNRLIKNLLLSKNWRRKPILNLSLEVLTFAGLF